MTYIAAHTPDRTAYRDQARAHFRAMFGEQRGWMELSAIEGDPDDRQRCTFHQGWFDYSNDRLDALVEKIADLVQRYGNVYTSITLYAEQKRDKDAALPGRVIFVDDAPIGSYTYTLQTSPDREQAFVMLGQVADVATREAIARQLAHAGADRSGWDITQLARVPGTFNTKRRAGGQYGRGPREWVKSSGHRVTLIPRTLRTYTLAELHQRAPKVERSDNAAGDIAALDWPEVERWLGNLAPLLDERDIPRRWKPHTQSYRVLTGEVVPVNDKGEADESTRRSFLARGCAYGRYPHDAAAAILWKLTSADYIARKGTAWHKADIARVIAKEYAIVAQRIENYQVRPITAAELKHGATAEPEPVEIVERTSRARHDRPQRFTPASLLARYRAEPALCELPRRQRAAQLEISTATLDRHESALRVLGLIRVERAGRGYAGRVALEGVIIIPPDAPPPEVLSPPIADVPIERVAAPENADCSPQCIGDTHPPEGGPSSPARPRSLPEAVRLAFAAVRVDQDTGEKRRVTHRRLMIALGPVTWSDAAIDAAIEEERDRRRIAAILLDIGQLKPPALKAQIRLMEHLAEKSRREGTNLHKYAEWAAREMRAELARRPAEPGRTPRKPTQARPDVRSGAAEIRQQQELEWLDLVDDLRAAPPRRSVPAAAARPAGGDQGGVCPPQPTPGTAASLIGSLYRLHAPQPAGAP